MRLQVKGRNLEVSEQIRTYAEEKLGKLDRLVSDPTRVELELAIEKNPSIVDTKQFSVNPMSPEEAILQLELIGHDFFVFRNAETEIINVVYRRRDGDYGLIEPN